MRIFPSILFTIFCFLVIITSHAQDEAINDMLLRDIKRNNLTRVDLLLKKGAEVNYRDANKATLLMWAAYTTNLDFVKKLVSLGADPTLKGVIYLNDDKKAFYGSLLTIAVAEKKMDLLNYLLDDLRISVNEREFDPDDQAVTGWTPIEWATYQRSREMMNYLIGKGAVIQPGVFVHGGLELHTRGKHQEAIDWTQSIINDYRQYMAGDSSLASMYYILAESYGGLEQNDKAIENYLLGLQHLENSGITTHPLHYAILLSLGLRYEEKKDYERARDTFLKITQHPELFAPNQTYIVVNFVNTNVEAFACLGRNYVRLKQYRQAEQTLRSALDMSENIKPENNDGSIHILGWLSELMGVQGRFNEALDYARQAVDKSTGYKKASSYVILGNTLEKMDDIIGAEEAFKKALDITATEKGVKSPEYEKILVEEFSGLYLKERALQKMIPSASEFLRNKMEQGPQADQAMLDHNKKIYEDFMGIFFLVSAMSNDRDSVFSQLTYDFFLAMNSGDEKQKRSVQAIRKKLGKKEVFVQILEALDPKIFPYYAVIIPKSTERVFIMPLYGGTDDATQLKRYFESAANLNLRPPYELGQQYAAYTALIQKAGQVQVKVPDGTDPLKFFDIQTDKALFTEKLKLVREKESK